MHSLAQRGLHALGVSRHPSPGLLQVERYEDAPGGDILVHLAESSDRAYVQANAPVYEESALATLTHLQARGFARVIYASSAVLYGDKEVSPRKVGDPVHQTDAYTRLKLASERVVLARNGAVARLANLYGPGMAQGNVVSTILGQLGQGGPVRVLDATPVRDFLWIQDAACALAEMATGSVCGIFNVGSGIGVSIRELALEILATAGQEGREVESIRAGAFSRLVLDIAQTQASLGWRPAVTLAEGVSLLVKSNRARK
jgi:nucleoside-diphosphate-sugar epimerase